MLPETITGTLVKVNFQVYLGKTKFQSFRYLNLKNKSLTYFITKSCVMTNYHQDVNQKDIEIAVNKLGKHLAKQSVTLLKETVLVTKENLASHIFG